MTSTKVVIRLLDASGHMLASVIHQAAVKGDACLRASSSIVVQADEAGTAEAVSVHWPDVNVETRVPMYAQLTPSVPLLLYPSGTVLMQAGQMPVSLPAVTVRTPIVAEPLTGAMGARGN